jgi:hypothetical protein
LQLQILLHEIREASSADTSINQEAFLREARQRLHDDPDWFFYVIDHAMLMKQWIHFSGLGRYWNNDDNKSVSRRNTRIIQWVLMGAMNQVIMVLFFS